MKFLLMILFSSPAFAGYWCPPSEAIVFPKPARKECVEVLDNDFDPKTASIVNGRLVIDQVEKERIERDAAAKKLKAAQEAAACEALIKEVDNVDSVPALRAIIKCILGRN